jgi:hypothetical protein
MADSIIRDGAPDAVTPPGSESSTAINARIAEIDTVLQSGASSVTVDGTTTAYDHKALRAERQRLETQLRAGTKRRRPYMMKPKLG